MPAEFRQSIEIQLLDDLQGEQIAAQNAYFSVQVGRIVIIRPSGSLAKAGQHGIRLIDGDASHRVINWRGPQGRNQRGPENKGQGSQDDPYALDQHTQVVTEDGLMAGK